MAIAFYGTSDRGDRREVNQDAILLKAEKIGNHDVGLFLVADGMGGLEQGEIISNYIAEQFQRWFEVDLVEIINSGQTSDDEIHELLEQEIWDINLAIKKYAETNTVKCGSTLSLLFILDERFYIKNLGDSRVYLFRKNQLSQLSEDQSLVAKKVRSGELSEEEAKTFPKKNVLTMCIGFFIKPEIFSISGKTGKEDVFLLCSDGFHNHFDETAVRSILNSNASLHEKCENLRALINPGDARDNVSIILVDMNG